MIDFFKDLATLTLIQHLIKYWLWWGVYTLILFCVLFRINKKSPK